MPSWSALASYGWTRIGAGEFQLAMAPGWTIRASGLRRVWPEEREDHLTKGWRNYFQAGGPAGGRGCLHVSRPVPSCHTTTAASPATCYLPANTRCLLLTDDAASCCLQLPPAASCCLLLLPVLPPAWK